MAQDSEEEPAGTETTLEYQVAEHEAYSSGINEESEKLGSEDGLADL